MEALLQCRSALTAGENGNAATNDEPVGNAMEGLLAFRLPFLPAPSVMVR